MKISALALASVLAVASAGGPQLSVSVRDGSFNGLDGLDPTVSWESSASSGDLDLAYGIKASARPTTDIASLPQSIWGRARTDVSGWGVCARAEVQGTDFSNADLEVDAENSAADLSLRLTANLGGSGGVRTVEATKGFDQKGARVTVTPRFNLEDDERDVEINYNNDKTNVRLTASADNQEVTFSQQVDRDNRIAPTVNSNGDISVEWERRLSSDSSLTANLKPNDSLNLEWRDSAWTANIDMPIDGTNINGANVHVKRDVNF